MLIPLLFLILTNSLSAQHKIFKVRDFGATGIKSQKATKYIQAAIDSAFLHGGGTVLFQSGEYLSGTLFLKSNINFHLDSGATLFASRDTNDYSAPPEGSKFRAFIYAGRAQNISLTGKGKIDGQAERVWEPLKSVDQSIVQITENAKNYGVEMSMYYKVPPFPFLIFMYNCSNLKFEDLTLWEANFWTLHLFNCENISIERLFVYSSLESGVNADGIDLNACRNATVKNCKIITGDDGICLKAWAGFNWPCSNIDVSDCEISSSSTALKIGTDSYGDFENIRFHDCKITDSNRGLSIVIRDGGNVRNVFFNDITIECKRRHFNWWGNADPIWIIVNKRREASLVGSIEGVYFNRISAIGRGTSKIESPFPESIRNIQLVNTHIQMLSEDYKDKRATWGFYAKNIKDLFLLNFSIQFDEKNPEPLWQGGLFIEQCKNLKLDDIFTDCPNVDTCAVCLLNTPGASLTNLHRFAKPRAFLSIAETDLSSVEFHNSSSPKKPRSILQGQTYFREEIQRFKNRNKFPQVFDSKE